MPRLRRFPILVFALVLAASCSPGTSGPIPGPVCGDPPELGYVCPDGVAPACSCETHEDGTVQWHCAQCGAIDCATNPNDPVCKADQSCIRCHGLASSEAGTGIENAHPWSYLGCVDCHGGTGVDLANPTRALTIEESHVHIPHDIAQSGSVTTADRTAYANYYLARSGVENLTGGLDWLRFANPGDLRIVDKTCGKSGCHLATSEAVKRSTMNTIVGKYDALQQGIGIPRASDLIAALGNDGYAKRLATYATAHIDDPNWDKNTSPPGSVPHVHALETVDREGSDPENFTETQMFQEAVNKICGNCHLGQNGNNNQYGNFRASGCTACHMPYKYDGQSNSKDLVINKTEPTYPAAYQAIAFPERPHTSRHVLKRTQTADECLTCHFGSARSVLQFMGIRTDDNRDLKNNNIQNVRYATQLVDNTRDPNARLHSRSEDQLVEYEDLDGNGQDDTPPDVHYLAGMECIDCHNTLDMHGDGRIYSRQDQATTVRCVHCHGNLEFDADPDATDNPVNSLFFATNKPTRKVLFKVTSAPGYGEVGYPAVSEPGIWLRTKSRGEWKWVPQIRWAAKWDATTQDCFDEGRNNDPRRGGFVCTPAASIAHGRWNGLNKAAGDFDDGVGPRPNEEVIQGYDGATSMVREGFSHTGEPASKANENPAGGLECVACHATWHNMRYGNHLGLKDTAGANKFYDWDRVTGQVTMGTQGWFDFTFISMLDLQLGIDGKGKIGYIVPTRLKMFVRHTVFDPRTNTEREYMRIKGDADFNWKTYRDRLGMGNLIYNSQGGITGAPGFSTMCAETQGECDFDNKKNINAGLGADTMQPHATQLRPRDCQKCHLNEAGNNTDYISAVYGWNANGFNANTSAYLNKIANVVTGNRGTYSTGNGFRIADDGIQHQLDHLVDHDTGYPLVYSIHVRTDDGQGGRPRRGYETYKRDAAGPINKELIDRLERIKVKNLFQQQ